MREFVAQHLIVAAVFAGGAVFEGLWFVIKGLIL